MVGMFIFLCIGMMGIEMFIHRKSPKIGHWVQEHPMGSLGFSVLISLVLAFMFPAAGLIVMTASLFSTIAMQPYYAANRRWAAFCANRETRRQSRRERWYSKFHQFHS